MPAANRPPTMAAMQTRLILLAMLAATSSASAQENLRPDVPVAIVGGMLLDGYEAEPIHHSVVVFENGRITRVGQKHDMVTRRAIKLS